MELDLLLKEKLDTILPILDEKQKRIVVAAEAKSLGRGGMAKISKITGMSRVTINSGIEELSKLVNEIDHLQQNIEWYKKTYETRSLFGMMREKLLRKKS